MVNSPIPLRKDKDQPIRRIKIKNFIFYTHFKITYKRVLDKSTSI